MSRLEDIQTAVEALMDARRGIVPVEVTTAIPLGVSERRLLERRLKEVVGADIRLTYKESPDLIGGIVAGWEAPTTMVRSAPNWLNFGSDLPGATNQPDCFEE